MTPAPNNPRPCNIYVRVSLELYQATQEDRKAGKLSDIVNDLLWEHYFHGGRVEQIEQERDEEIERVKSAADTVQKRQHGVEEHVRRRLERFRTGWHPGGPSFMQGAMAMLDADEEAAKLPRHKLQQLAEEYDPTKVEAT